MGVEFIDAKEVVSITRIRPYEPLTKSTAKMTKDPDSVKYKVFTQFLLDKILVEGDMFTSVPFMNMEDLDLSGHAKFPQLEPKKYLKSIYYEESSVTMLKPMKQAAKIERTGFPNMFWVPHFNRNIINTIYVYQFFASVHD